MFNFDAALLRPDWMRPPCWRWNVTLGYLAEPEKALTQIREDAFLYESVKYYRDKKKLAKKPELYFKKFPEMTLAHDIFYNSSYAGWRWFVEALILAKLSDGEIRKALKIDIPVDVLSVYRKVFFDVDPYIESEVAVAANIFSTSRLEIDGKKDCDYTWKLFAYNWGAEPFLEQFARKRTEIHTKYAKWFRDLAKECLTINAFQLSSDLKKTYNLETLEILRIAKEYWTITDMDFQKGKALADDDFVSSLSSHIDMCLMHATEKESPVEQRANFKYAFIDELSN